MDYKIEWTPAAARHFRKLPADAQQRIAKRVNALAGQPRPPGVQKLSGPEGFLRIRAGDYRIIYLVQDRRLLVVVVEVGHRREIHRDF